MTDTSYGSFQPYYSWRRMSMPPVAVAAQRPNSDSPTLSSLLSSSSNSNDSPPAIVLAQPYTNPRRAPSASRDNSNSSSNEGSRGDDTGGGGGHKGPCQIVCLIWSMFVTGFVVLWAVFSLYKALA